MKSYVICYIGNTLHGKASMAILPFYNAIVLICFSTKKSIGLLLDLLTTCQVILLANHSQLPREVFLQSARHSGIYLHKVAILMTELLYLHTLQNDLSITNKHSSTSVLWGFDSIASFEFINHPYTILHYSTAITVISDIVIQQPDLITKGLFSYALGDF